MRYYICCFLIIIAHSVLQAQNKVSFNLGIGHYALNSENSMRIMMDERYRAYFLCGFTYERENLWGNNFQFEYSYHQNTKEHVLQFVRIDELTGTPASITPGDVSLIMHNFDLSYVQKINNDFSYGYGLSFAVINRIIDIQNSLYDKLASSGLGVNCYIAYTRQLTEEEHYYYFTAKVKLRYIHSVWFDKGIRNLDDYSQYFFTDELSVGVGYAF